MLFCLYTAILASQRYLDVYKRQGTGQAAATMPIMAPVGDLVGLTRQSTVLAFQLGDGLTNACLLYTSRCV